MVFVLVGFNFDTQCVAQVFCDVAVRIDIRRVLHSNRTRHKGKGLLVRGWELGSVRKGRKVGREAGR